MSSIPTFNSDVSRKTDLSPHSQLRSSLRSPGKRRSGALRVVFSDSKTFNSSPERDIIRNSSVYELSKDISSTRRLNLSDANTNKSSRDARLSNFDNFYRISMTSAPQHGHLVQKLENGKRAVGHRACSERLPAEIKISSQPASGGTPTQHTGTEIKSRNPFNIKSGFSDASLSAQVLPESSQPLMMRPAVVSSEPGKVGEPAPHSSSSPPGVEHKQSKSLHSLMSPNHCCKDFHKEFFSSELSNDTAVTGGQSPSRLEKESQVTAVLQQLLKLVDCHWSGSGSLLANKDFLVPAQNLLFHLVDGGTPQQDAHLTAGHSSSASAGSDPKDPRTQLKYTEQLDRMDTAVHITLDQQMRHLGSVRYLLLQESKISTVHLEKSPGSASSGVKPTLSSSLFSEPGQLLQQLGRGPGDSPASASTLQEKDHTAASRYHTWRNQAPIYDELLWKNSQLSSQVERLRLEVKQLTRLQETVALLQDSQRSLASTTSFLLQQLNKASSHPARKTTLPSEKCIVQEPPSLLGRTASLPSLCSSVQCCSSEQLCSCPL